MHIIPKLAIILSSTLLASTAFSESKQKPANDTGTHVSSKDQGVESTLKRIEAKVDVILDTGEKQSAVIVNQPLGDKTQGIEFNFIRLLGWGGSERTISGTYSRFYTDKNVEIAFPFMYSAADQKYYNEGSGSTSQLRSLTLDAHYRMFLGHSLNGFYLSAFTRAAYLSGQEGDRGYYYGYSLNPETTHKNGSEFKLGIGAGIGYRIFSTKNTYWGCSLSVGKYLLGESDKFSSAEGVSADIDDAEFILDVELLKFGYAF